MLQSSLNATIFCFDLVILTLVSFLFKQTDLQSVSTHNSVRNALMQWSWFAAKGYDSTAECETGLL